MEKKEGEKRGERDGGMKHCIIMSKGVLSFLFMVVVTEG